MFIVLANKNQLVEHNLYHPDTWMHCPGMPDNRLYREFFTFDAAAAQYHQLRTMGLTALKNWL
jgi:hypothetical protein